MSAPALLERFPLPRRRPPVDRPWKDDWPVVPADAVARFPLLAADLQLWHDELESPFRVLDHEAQIHQRRFWGLQIVLILGGLVATVLGACKSEADGGSLVLAVIQAAVTLLLTAVAVVARRGRAQRGYLTRRLKAERIKSEFFLFLARAGDYQEPDRDDRLRRRITAVVEAEDAP